MQISGIILAGGKSSRMGSDKSLLKFGELTQTKIIYDKIKSLCSEIIISTNNSSLKIENTVSVPDIYKEIGPAGGIQACLKYSKTEKNIVVSCDSPFISANLFQYLLQKSEKYDVCVPVYKGKINPLIGIYDKNFLPVLESFIMNNNYKLLNIINKAKNIKIDITEKLDFFNENLFYNINTKNDYLKAQKIYKNEY